MKPLDGEHRAPAIDILVLLYPTLAMAELAAELTAAKAELYVDG